MVFWLQFAVLTAIIVVSGSNLSRYGDIIAEKTGLGRTWIGVLLMASVTSLPELVTGVSSAAIFDLPDIAAGDVLGSCMFNLLIVALLDAISGPSPISAKAHQGQVLTAGFGIFMLGIVSVSLFAGSRIPGIAWMGAYTPVIFLIYLMAMRAVFLYEKKRIAELIQEMAEAARYDHITKARAYTMYGLNAALTIGAATYLPYLGEKIAEMTGLGQTFVGSVFIALTTSLPEVVVSVAAIKIDAVDLVFGNILGSNLFNLAILALDDLFYTRGPILSYVTETHLVSAIAAMTMTAIVIVGLTYRTSKKVLFFSWDSLGVVAVYAVAVYILYGMRSGS